MDSEPQFDFDAREFLRVLRRRKLVVLASILVLVALGVGLSLLQTPVYSAKTTVLIPQDVRDSVNQNANPGVSTPDLLDRQLQNEISFAQGDRVRGAVRKSVGLVPDVSIALVPNTDELAFSANSGDPAGAANQANAYARAYLDQRRKSKTANFFKTAQTVFDEIRSLRTKKASLPPGDPQVAGIQQSIINLQGSLGDLRASGQLSKVGGDIVRQATTPESPVSPNIPRNGLIAAILGLVLGIALAFARDRFDDSIKSKTELEEATGGLTVMALIPRAEDWPDPDQGYVVSSESPHSPSAESYRTLRVSLQIRARSKENPLRALALTSPGAAEGKSATVANLGVALARAGQRVVVVGCDLRRPRIQSFFGLENSMGFTSVLLGESTPDDVLQEVEGVPGLSVMASGPVVPDPSELLSLSTAQRVIEYLKARWDFVLVDCPPVLPVPDMLQISQMVDGVMVLAAARRSTKRSLSRAIELLEQAGAPLVGSVLNDVRSGGEDDYGYGSYDAYYASGQDGRTASTPRAAPGAGAGEPRMAERGLLEEHEPREPGQPAGQNDELLGANAAAGDSANIAAAVAPDAIHPGSPVASRQPPSNGLPSGVPVLPSGAGSTSLLGRVMRRTSRRLSGATSAEDSDR